MDVRHSLAVLVVALLPIAAPRAAVGQAVSPSLSTGGINGAVGGGPAAGATSIAPPPSPGLGIAPPRAGAVTPIEGARASMPIARGGTYLSSRRLGRTRMRAIQTLPPRRLRHHRRLRRR